MKHGDKLTLVCTGCGQKYAPPRLHCDACDALLRSEYAHKSFDPGPQLNLFAFHDWLPPSETSDEPIGTVVHPSKGLANRLDLPNLSIAFSGYAPALGARNPTGSFKDFEAIPSLLYFREHGIPSVVLASAGNTARAFAYAAVRLDFPVVIVIPERALPRLWIPCAATDAVRLVVLRDCDDYADAIRIAGLIGRVLGIANEGGARNVARRDGMSTVMLEYARRLSALPAHYVQAIGSGTGAISVWEASQRLLDAGIGRSLPKLHLAQNAPFAPVHDAWTLGTPIEPDVNTEEQLRRIDQIDALVLANRRPPYAVTGGVQDALASTNGSTYAIANTQARKAAEMFEALEGVPIGPAAAVAMAALEQAIDSGRVKHEDPVLLHITGNNETLLQDDAELQRIEPAWVVRPDEITERTLLAARGRFSPAI